MAITVMLWCVPGAGGEVSLKPGRHQGWASPSKGILSPLAHSRLQELSLHLVVLKSDVLIFTPGGFPDGSDGKKKKKKLPALQKTPVQSLGQEDTLEKGMETHSSFLDWRIPWTEEAGRL